MYLAGCSANPDGRWTTQQARQLAGSLAERPTPIRFLIHDRDSKFSRAFDDVFRSEGDRDHPHPVSGTKRERVRRTVDRDRSPRLPRLAPDHEPQTARARPPHLRRALQPTQATPSTRSDPVGASDAPTARQLEPDRPDPPTRPPWRTHPRIRPSSMTDGFTHPTRSHIARSSRVDGGAAASAAPSQADA